MLKVQSGPRAVRLSFLVLMFLSVSFRLGGQLVCRTITRCEGRQHMFTSRSCPFSTSLCTQEISPRPIFSFLLTARYKLALPNDHPLGPPSHIGHQAFSQIRLQHILSSSLPNDTSKVPSDREGLGGGGWKMPRNDWNPLVYDPTPITELTIKSCLMPPGLYDLCAPLSSKKEDALRGKWVRIDRDLNRRIGLYYVFLFERRLLSGSTAPVVTNMTLLTHSPTIDDLAEGVWVEVSASIRTGVWPTMAPMFLHYQLTEQSDILNARLDSPTNDAGPLEPITEIDVVYGSADVSPLWGFTKMDVMMTGGPDDPEAAGTGITNKKRAGSSLAIRRKEVVLPITPALRFDSSGNYTILQVADLHLSVGPGTCKDLDPKMERECKAMGADAFSIRWLETSIGTVRPDLIVFTGDQSNGQETSWSPQSTILKFAPIVWKQKIPWTVIFGNHDDEDGLSRAQQMQLLQSLPYFIGESGPNGVDGTGNYIRSVKSGENDATLLNLYFLDSHAYAKSLNPWKNAGYDFLKPSQINWFNSISAQVKPMMRPYKPSISTSGTGQAEDESSTLASTGTVKPLDDEDDDLNRRNYPIYRKRQEIGATDPIDEDGVPIDSTEVLEEMEDELEDMRNDKFGPEAGASLGAAVMPNNSSKVRPDGETLDDVVYPESTSSQTDENNDNALLRKPLRPFNEDFNGDEILPASKLADGPNQANPMEAKPNAMVFFHIPLPETYKEPADVGKDGKRLIIGDRYEGEGSSKTNGGFFSQALLHQGELVDTSSKQQADEFWDGEFAAPTSGRPEVKIVANGHCHISEDCRRVKGIWMCFGGGGSYSGYGKGGLARRMRVYQASEYGERISTYQLLDTLQKHNEFVLIGDDAL